MELTLPSATPARSPVSTHTEYTENTVPQMNCNNPVMKEINEQYPCVFSGPGEAPSPSGSVLALLESLQKAPHLEVHKDTITWILKVNADVTVCTA